jgi:hypothetical protein
MKRSIGVTVAAAFSLLGSLFLFARGVLVIVAMTVAHGSNAQQIGRMPQSFLIAIFLLVYLAPAVWGIATSVGLFRLKPWARISMLIFSTLLVVMGCLSGLTTVLITLPTPPNSNLDPGLASGVRIALAGFWMVLAVIGAGWLILFTRSGVKAQFVRSVGLGIAGDPLQVSSGPTTVPGSNRPLSITVIAWLLIVGCVFLVISVMLHTPAALFTMILSGWKAGLLYLSFACISLTVAIGLFQLKLWARATAIVYLGFGMLNALVFYFAPGASGRFSALMDRQQALFPWLQPLPSQSWQPIPAGMLIFAGVIGVIVTAIPIYFLMIHKKAFEEAGTASLQGAAAKTLL